MHGLAPSVGGSVWPRLGFVVALVWAGAGDAVRGHASVTPMTRVALSAHADPRAFVAVRADAPVPECVVAAV